MPTAYRAEYLTIASTYIIGTRACFAKNLQTLHNERHRGRDRLLPGSAGVIAHPRRLAPVDFSLELVIDGHYTEDNAPVANSHQGVRDNIDSLRAVTAPVTSGNGTRTVVWTRPNASTKTAACHVGPLIIGQSVGPGIVLATLDLSIAAGTWT